MAHEIFISYSTKDDKIAEAVCAAIERCGITCWMAPRDIRAGEDWDEAILDAIENCRMVLLLLSSQSNKSEHVKRELLFAVESHCDIVSLRTEDVAPSKKLRYALGSHQWVDGFPPPLTLHLAKLASDLQLRLIKLKSQAPELAFVSPVAGESWGVGERHEIRWKVNTASERTMERMKLALYQANREVQTIADSALGFSVMASHCDWAVPADLPPGSDYQLRMEIADDEGDPGSAAVDFSLQSAAAPADARKETDVVAALSPGSEVRPAPPTSAAESKPAQVPAPPQAAEAGPARPSTKRSERIPSSVPFALGVVFFAAATFVGVLGFGGAVHEAFVQWQETSPKTVKPPPLGTLTPPITTPGPPPTDGAAFAIWLANHPKPEESGWTSPIDKMALRITHCLDKAASVFGAAALRGLGAGAAVGGVWLVVLGIAAREQRRPLEMVFDEWKDSFQMHISVGAVISGLYVLFAGLEGWQWAFGIGSALGLVFTVLDRWSTTANQRRQAAILGNESKAK